MKSNINNNLQYKGGCLCGATTYVANGQPINPHLCSCTMCQKASGAPTVAWVSFLLEQFKWTGNMEPVLYQSSKNTKRCFCKNCGGALATLDEGAKEEICITIASLDNPDLIVPNKQHSYADSKPPWWEVKITD